MRIYLIEGIYYSAFRIIANPPAPTPAAAVWAIAIRKMLQTVQKILESYYGKLYHAICRYAPICIPRSRPSNRWHHPGWYTGVSDRKEYLYESRYAIFRAWFLPYNFRIQGMYHLWRRACFFVAWSPLFWSEALPQECRKTK